jgi:hypothetical protein
MNSLINIKNFRPIYTFKKTDLSVKGLYAIRVKNISILPSLFKTELISMETTLIYIGKGERTIYERIQEECYGIGNGTFFRGIGALLTFKPIQGSLIDKINKKNYRFSPQDRDKIVEWINSNLDLNFVELDNEIGSIEQKLIKIYCPILNTVHNPKKSKTLASLRKACREYALLKV